MHLTAISAAIDEADGVDYVENITVQRIAVAGAFENADANIGIRIGQTALLGEDTRLGGRASVALHRLKTDHTGEAETILVQPWELVHVQLAREAVQRVAVGDWPGSAGARFRG